MVQPEKVIPPVLHYLSPLHCPSLSFVTWPQRHTVVTFCMKKCQHGALSALFLNRILMSWALFLYLTHCFPHSHWETWQNVSTESLGAISAWIYVHNKFAGLFSLLFKKNTFFLTRLICCLVSEKKTARWGARKRREAVIDCLLVCDLFHMKHTWHSCQRFLFAPFLVSFTLLITLLISDAIKCFTVCALAQGVLLELHYIKASMLHAWQPTLHFSYVITTLLPWNWSILALWQLPLQLCVHQLIKSLFSWLPKQTLFPSDTRVFY